MRRHVAVAIAACCMPLALPVAAGAQAAVPRAIVALRAAAGCPDASGDRVEIGRHDGDGLSGAYRATLAGDGRFALSVHEEDFVETSGFDGTTAWSQDFSGGSHSLDAPDAVAVARTDAWLRTRGWCRSEPATRYRSYGERVVGNAHTEVVSVTPQGGAPATLRIDRASGLLDGVAQQLNEIRRITTYGDWRMHGAVAFPFETVVDYPEDESVERYELRDISTAARIPARAFARPPLPRDFGIRSPLAAATVPLSLEGDKPIVDATIGGVGPLPFELDSGGHVILTTDTARRLGLAAVGHASALGQGTAVAAARFVRVPTIRIGDAYLRGLVATVLPLPSYKTDRGPKPRLAGILGLGLFERFSVAFDPDRRTVTFRSLMRPRPLPSGVRLPLSFDDDAPLTPCTIDGRRGPCMIDTGNGGFTIVEHHWAARNGLLKRLRSGLRYDNLIVRRATLGLGPLRLQHELVEYDGDAVRGSEATTIEAAILAEGLLDRYRTTIDYGSNVVWFHAAHGARRRPFNRVGMLASKISDGSFVVRSILPRSPAERSGVVVGDRIVGVDGVPSRSLSRARLFDLTTGPIGRVLHYKLRRRGAREVRDVDVRLSEILP